MIDTFLNLTSEAFLIFPNKKIFLIYFEEEKIYKIHYNNNHTLRH